MFRRTFAVALACAIALAVVPRHAVAAGLAVDVWLDRGDAAVYQPGQALGIRSHVSQDAYLLVYEIDSQGYVNLLYPIAGRSGFVDGRKDLDIPPDDSQLDLVVQGPVGEGYVVAIASETPFHDLPWYLRPYDAHAEAVGYQGDTPPEEQGVTSDGRIVGDPFVAMEKIRRRVLAVPDDQASFATAYSSYYVHEVVKYPRYLCDDCHRPDYWTWWPGYDPYFATCSVFDFRVNWGWYWGPSYWTGCVPYYVYVPRADCPPAYAPAPGITYSSWLGWNKWNALWGGRLKHKEMAAPQGYVSPDRYRDGRVAGQQGRYVPPGYATRLAANGGLRSGRTTPYGRFNDLTRTGGMIDTHGGVQARPMSPTREGGASGGLTRPRPVWDTNANGRGAIETPRSAPQRYEVPRRDATPQRYGSPQREATPAPRATAPAPRVTAPAPRSATPAPATRTATPAPRTAAPAAPARPAAPATPHDGGDQAGGHR